MKRLYPALLILCLASAALLPANLLLRQAFRCQFDLYVPACYGFSSLLALGTLFPIFDTETSSRWHSAVCALLSPCSFLFAMYLLLVGEAVLPALPLLIPMIGGIFLIRRAHIPLILRGFDIILSALLAFSACAVLCIFLLFFNFGEVSVVRTVSSPNHALIAEVIDSDQGALGGDTLVNVRRAAPIIRLGIGELTLLPVRVYTGEWGEFSTMEIEWQSDATLLIDGTPYFVPDIGNP
ncbi:MAG: hypothetical protein Q4E13_12400 [Clostridia bacterium]|nr:hypothetical protein [Clostridia bacterium]